MQTVEQQAPASTPAHEAANDSVYGPRAANDPIYNTPPHTQTQSTLAPTAEFTRIFLLAWIIRYVFRGGAGTAFEKEAMGSGLRNRVTNWLSKPGRAITKRLLPKLHLQETEALNQMEAATYASFVGIGSGYLSYRYSKLVRSDIHNIFSETVAYERGKNPADVSFNDITQSDNNIIRRTVQNYREKLWGRIGTDALFFVAAALRHAHLTDFFLGLKGVQIFADTWKRKTTMFEDLVTFINNKINPRNGLGQQINVGEIFDLYQHYAEAFHPDKMFHNVLERGTGEGIRWAQNQPIFERMTELLNLTYAYKHSSKIDPNTGHAIHQADFALPKFIYLLGHDLIDVSKPQQTLATIEIANRFGIPAVKEMQTMFASGATLQQVTERFPIPARKPSEHKTETTRNDVRRREGSTMQLDRAEMPATTINAETALKQPLLSALAPAPTLI